MKGQSAPLRLTARGEAVRDYLEAAVSLAAIAVSLFAIYAALKMIGY
ncbi:membrane protein [Arthrobacter phage Hirko]|nr:membrane protein [Arthrobacter phage Hirko]